MNAKGVIILLLVIIVVLGATGGEDSAAAVGSAIGEAVHLVRVAWDAMVNSNGT
jgi:Sec-independent protein translocase protein TatA